MTTQAPARTDAEIPSVSRLGFRTIIVAGMGLAAGIWATSRFDQHSAVTFPGRLQSRMVTITAEWPARLQAVHVKPGQRVAAGMNLFVLEPEQSAQQAALRKQDAARKEQDAIRVKAAAELELHWRRRELQAEIFQTQLRLAGLRQEKVHLEVEQVAWRERLSVKSVFQNDAPPAPLFRFISESSPDVSDQRMQAMLKEDAAAAAAQALTAQIALCEQRLEELKSLDGMLESQVRKSHGVDLAEEQLRLAAETAAVEIEDVTASTTVTSPSYGLIGLFHKQTGELVQAGEVLVQILDDDRRTIEVEVPSWTVGHFTPGKQIPLEFPGSERRTGVISAIPPQTSAPQTDSDRDALVTLVVEPAGKLWPPVPIGSRVLVYQP